MSGSKIEHAQEALARFIETSHRLDEFFLIDFNSSARLLLDKTRDGAALLNKLTYVQPHGNTAPLRCSLSWCRKSHARRLSKALGYFDQRRRGQ